MQPTAVTRMLLTVFAALTLAVAGLAGRATAPGARPLHLPAMSAHAPPALASSSPRISVEQHQEGAMLQSTRRRIRLILAALALAGLAAMSLPATAAAGASTTPLTPTVASPPALR